MKVVVTGAAGFIGSHLAESLVADGHEVAGVDCFTDYYPRALKERNLERLRESPRFHLVEARLQDLDLASLLDGAEHVYHLAAQAGVRASWGREFALYADHNVLATQRLLEAALAAGRPTVVYASSSSVYGDAPSLPLREDAPCQPVSPYGVTKLAGEHLAVLYHRNHGLPTVSLRFFTVYGPRQRPDMAFHRFLKAARDGTEVTLFGDGRQTRDFTYIQNVIQANLAACAAGREAAGESFNVAFGARVSLLELLEKMAALRGEPVKPRFEPGRKGDVRDSLADVGKARRLLGYRPEVSLDEGLRRTLEALGALGTA